MKLNVIPEKVNLLYIEDDPSIVDLVTQQLNSTQHTTFNITSKPTLAEGLDYVQECTIDGECLVDVILLDLTLPNSQGINTFLKVKEAVDFVPIVIISAHEDIACKCVSLGAQDYLVKPHVPPSLLIRSIKYAIQRSAIERKMRNVIMTSSLGYHMYELIDDEVIFVGYNPAAEKILGVNHKQFIDKEINEAFPNLSPEVEEKYRDALINGTPWKDQVIPYKDDNIHHGYYKINAYRTAVNQLAVTFEDVTEQVHKEKALKASEEKYRSLVEVTGAGMYGIDFEADRFTHVNDIICNKLGYSQEEMLNMSPKDILTEESIDIWIDRLVALKQGDFIEDSVEYEVIKKDGTTMWVLVTAQFVEDTNKDVIGANVVAIDITEKKLAQKALKEKEKEVYTDLEQKIRDWKLELELKSQDQDNKLQMIDAEILTLDGYKKAEVF